MHHPQVIARVNGYSTQGLLFLAPDNQLPWTPLRRDTTWRMFLLSLNRLFIRETSPGFYVHRMFAAARGTSQV